MNMMQKLILARAVAQSLPDAEAYERAARRRKRVLKYLLFAFIVAGAIECIKFYL